MWKLVIEDDEGKRTVVPLTRDQYSIGRKDGNTIRLTERNVSREHARLYKKNGSSGGGEAATTAQSASHDRPRGSHELQRRLRQRPAHNARAGPHARRSRPDRRLPHRPAGRGAARGAAAPPRPTTPSRPCPACPRRTPARRRARLLDRPNRLVMLAGPAPGAEFPLDRDRMTDRPRRRRDHLGQPQLGVPACTARFTRSATGRFEIVDKGSSNGVRVNGADLRRGIVEPGDVIELGDVHFKFVGAGQVFRPTESQQRVAISDRQASEIVRGRRGSTRVPVGDLRCRRRRRGARGMGLHAATSPSRGPCSGSSAAAAPSPEQAALDEAKTLCAVGRLRDRAQEDRSGHRRGVAPAQHARLQGRRDAVGRPAARAGRRRDRHGRKQAMYQRVSQAMAVDPSRRKTAADKLQQLEAVADALPTAAPVAPPSAPSSNKTHSEESVSATPRPEGNHRAAVVAANDTPPPAAAPAAPSPATVAPAKAAGLSVDDRERALALQGTQDSKVLLKRQLEQRVTNGKASDSENQAAHRHLQRPRRPRLRAGRARGARPEAGVASRRVVRRARALRGFARRGRPGPTGGSETRR